jgi:hypothetical protein
VSKKLLPIFPAKLPVCNQLNAYFMTDKTYYFKVNGQIGNYQTIIEKSDLNWFEYEQYIFTNYSHRYPQVKSACPVKMLQSLKTLN